MLWIKFGIEIPSKSEVIGRCGGDEKTECPHRTDKSGTLIFLIIIVYIFETLNIVGNMTIHSLNYMYIVYQNWIFVCVVCICTGILRANYNCIWSYQKPDLGIRTMKR